MQHIFMNNFQLCSEINERVVLSLSPFNNKLYYSDCHIGERHSMLMKAVSPERVMMTNDGSAGLYTVPKCRPDLPQSHQCEYRKEEGPVLKIIVHMCLLSAMCTLELGREEPGYLVHTSGYPESLILGETWGPLGMKAAFYLLKAQFCALQAQGVDMNHNLPTNMTQMLESMIKGVFAASKILSNWFWPSCSLWYSLSLGILSEWKTY